MIYFDNAATGGFKPNFIIDSATDALKHLLTNPSRSSHRLSIMAEEMIFNTRSAVAKFFNNGSENRVIFTKNCTESLNTAFFSLLKKGDHVITTVFEHNSTLRPLNYLKNLGVITLDIVDNKGGLFENILRKIKTNTKLITINQVSNVTGEEQNIQKIGEFCNKNGIYFSIDGAQSAGHIKIDMQKQNIDLLSIPTHKGMYGLTGGVLILSDRVNPAPFILGGTGTETFNLDQPNNLPERLESGTLNLPLIVSFFDSVNYVSKNLDFFSKRLTFLTNLLIEQLKNFEKITVYSQKNKSGIVSFSLSPFSSMEVADYLNKNYDIAVRGGFHCAPLMHNFLGTSKEGLVRVSLAPENNETELNLLITALKNLLLS